MLRLLSLNTEGNRHDTTVFSCIDTVEADIVSLYEAPVGYITRLAERGYFSTFAPMCTHNPVAPDEAIGILVATKTPAVTTTTYYESTYGAMRPHDKHDAHSKAYPCITTTVTKDNEVYTIASVHLFDTWNGVSSPDQDANVSTLLDHLATLPPHVLCGDFNMPRGYNTNYERFTERYADMIPTHYASSLDRTLHRAGARTDLNAPIFDIYMVDYIFTQPSYTATNVRLEFGISDHAAVVADIMKV